VNHPQTSTPYGDFLPTRSLAEISEDAAFEVTMRDGTVQPVFDADAYEPERQMTTFYRTGNSRAAIDGWSVRLASFRTDEILMIRRCRPPSSVRNEATSPRVRLAM
jgi:hypothetical protein